MGNNEVVRLMPELPEAHAEFEEVLKRKPTNELALKSVQALRAKPGSRKPE